MKTPSLSEKVLRRTHQTLGNITILSRFFIIDPFYNKVACMLGKYMDPFFFENECVNLTMSGCLLLSLTRVGYIISLGLSYNLPTP